MQPSSSSSNDYEWGTVLLLLLLIVLRIMRMSGIGTDMLLLVLRRMCKCAPTFELISLRRCGA
jgi:hypothetical protein